MTVKRRLEGNFAILHSKKLNKLGVSAGGWDIYFFDSHEKSYWKLFYPNSEFQGGGAPVLEEINFSDIPSFIL